MKTRVRKTTIVLLLITLILIPFNVNAAGYKIVLSYFTNGGSVAGGNVEDISGVLFLKNSMTSDITYSNGQTISHINSLDGTNLFTLKKKGVSQTPGKEWYTSNYSNGERVYFSNSETYSVSKIIKKIGMDDNYAAQVGEISVFLQANYAKPIKVKSVSLNTSILTLKVGKTFQLNPKINPSNATNKEVTWKSEDPSIVTVTSEGVVKGIKAGKAKVVATTKDGNKVAKCLVKVKGGSTTPVQQTIKVTDIKLNKTNTKIEVGKNETVKATVSPTNATNKEVTWKSSNEKIATVTNGKITAKKEGKVTISATTKDGNKKASMSVETTTKKSYYVSIEYNANNGQLGSLHNKEITIKNNKIYKGNNSIFHKIVYNVTTGTSGLADYNNTNFIYLTREGYIINKGKEWNTKPDGSGKSYDQLKEYKASDFCNANDKDCKVVLYANWKKAKTTRINLATFNIGFFNCGGSDFNCSPTVKNFSNLISKNNIDIIGLQEARLKNYFLSSSNKKKSNESIKSIGSNVGLNNNYIIAPKNVDAILSKYKLKSKQEIPLVSCTSDGVPVEKRAIQKTIININGVDISYYNTHLDYHYECAAKHMDNLANIIKEDKNPIIITADYNRVQIDNYEKYLKPLGFEIAAHDTNYKGKGQNSYMDSVFVLSRNHIDIVSSKTVLAYKKYSDHNLVIATLDIK